jgi:succinate dehydrogenase/fumarate reductase flavoprotein subunit
LYQRRGIFHDFKKANTLNYGIWVFYVVAKKITQIKMLKKNCDSINNSFNRRMDVNSVKYREDEKSQRAKTKIKEAKENFVKILLCDQL